MLKHQHVIIRAEVLSPPGPSHCQHTQEWFKKLIDDIQMKILLGPFVTYCSVPGNQGMTGICAIETSSITLHSWDESPIGVVQLDVYTCADLNLEVVFEALGQFSPIKIEYHFIDRDDGIKVINSGKILY